jgi:hypothetical protein
MLGQPRRVPEADSSLKGDLDFWQWLEHVEDIGAVRPGHGTMRQHIAKDEPAAKCAVVLVELRPPIASSLLEYGLDCGEP